MGFRYHSIVRKIKTSVTVTHTLMLLFAAMLWGFAFVAQSIGADYMDPYSFSCFRSWITVLALLPVIALSDAFMKAHYGITQKPKNAAERKHLVRGGMIAGLFVFLLSLFQQIGIAYVPTAKAGFMTAMYIILVPVSSVLFGKKLRPVILGCVVLSFIGMYLLTNPTGGGFGFGEWMMIGATLSATAQIMAIDHFCQNVDGVRLSFMQFLTMAVLSTVAMFVAGHPEWQTIKAAMPAILYTAIVSGGLAYTLQIIGQRNLDPTIASLAMCMESVFSAVGGWIFLHQNLSAREWTGCAVMFAAIVLANLPSRRKDHEK
ncbi:MAG: DMT family transporter [Erysipelotrichales bacterium]|nr:DMT family transporter [Erysipelotrichales bacterium]